MNSQSDNQPGHHERGHSGRHGHRRRKSHKPSFFSRLGKLFSSGSRHHRPKKMPLSERLKHRYEEFKAEFSLPQRQRRESFKHVPLKDRIKHRLKVAKDDLLIPRIKKEKLPKPKLSIRVSQQLQGARDDLAFKRLMPKVGKRIPMKAKIKYWRETVWKKYSVIFSKEWLIISFNSLVFFITAYYVVHFITQLITGLVCHWFDIQTTLFYSTTDYHFTIKSVIEGQVIMNKWTLIQIITVFASAPVACLILAIVAYRFLTMKRFKFGFRRFFRKIGRMFMSRVKRQELKMQEAGQKRGKKINIPANLKLLMIWFICHSFTYFFSGMLFSWLFFMRFGYVTGYIFDSFFFDNLAASLSLISMVLLGFLFVSLFLHSSKMYFNQLVDWTRMPFAFSQILIPTVIGLAAVIITQLPKIILKIAAMQASMVILILPLLWRGQMYPEIQFDYNPRKITIPWRWIITCLVLSAAMVIALKFGIKIY